MRFGCRTVAGQPLAPCSVRGLNTARSHAYGQIALCPTSKRVVAPRSGAVRARAMFGGLGNLLKGDPAKKTQERLQPIVDQVNKLESQMQSRSDDELRKITVSLQERAQSGTPLDTLLPEAFAVRISHSQYINMSRLAPLYRRYTVFVHAAPTHSEFWCCGGRVYRHQSSCAAFLVT